MALIGGILGEAVAPFRNQVVISSKFGWNIDLETAPLRTVYSYNVGNVSDRTNGQEFRNCGPDP
jgi:aryl-alcohol dehydrogenase-like predicted oxidoreductase